MRNQLPELLWTVRPQLYMYTDCDVNSAGQEGSAALVLPPFALLALPRLRSTCLSHLVCLADVVFNTDAYVIGVY